MHAGTQSHEHPEDVLEHTSQGLSAVITTVLDDDEVAQPATLADVREAVLAEVRTVTILSMADS